MVETHTGSGNIQIVLTPNRSMSWQNNKHVILAMALWSGSIAIGFIWMGAWLVAPFIGLELLALAAGLYYVCWKLSHQEVLHINDVEVLLEKGIHWPKQSWRWQHQQVKVRIESAAHPWQTPTIRFSGDDREDVRVGAFLNLDDCEILIKQLTTSGLITRCYPPRHDVPY